MKHTKTPAKHKIVQKPSILAGKAVIEGTRITVEFVLELLASGLSVPEIAKEYTLKEEDVRTAVAYAARELSREEVRDISMPAYAPARG